MRGLARVAAALMLCLVLCAPALAENDGDAVYTLTDRSGRVLTQRAGRMYVGDGYIAGDDAEYRVVAVNDEARTAVAEPVATDAAAFAALAAEPGNIRFTDSRITPSLAVIQIFTLYMVAPMAVEVAPAAEAVMKDAGGKKLVCMYSTHSDESYVPDDGDSSKWKGAGIYDVGDRLKAALEERGIDAVYSHETFLPHDADAYTRSRRTAEELLKKGPDALLDIHRDAVPAEQYETEVDGEDISKVRLFVGRSNQNAAENRAFARQLKTAADELYPGLVKDIFIGKGNYNQELYPHALLLEFGTHEIEKAKAEAATAYMAEVLDRVLYGGAAKAEGGAGAAKAPVAKGIGWTLGLALLAAAVYALAATGSPGGAWKKLRERAGELTGGLLGGRPRK